MHMCACACTRAMPSPTPHPTPSTQCAQLSLHLTSAAHPPAPPSFHNIHGSSIPSAPSPKCTQLNAHSATPTSLPDNTTAGHPIIFMHMLRTHSYTAVRSALCWQRCLSNASVLMHGSHVSACHDYFLHTQNAEAGVNARMKNSNKAKEDGKRWKATFLFPMTFG